MDALVCPWPAAQHLIFSDNVPTLLFYSHLPPMLLSLGIGLFVFLSTKRSLVGSLLLFVTVLFSLWGFFDLILWATNDPDSVLFFWSLQVLLEPVLFFATLYLTYAFVKEKDLLLSRKMLLAVLFVPFIFLVPTAWNLIGVNLVDCTAIEGPLAQYYSYALEVIVTGIIALVSYQAWSKADGKRRGEIKNFSLGVFLFLVCFSWGNFVGSFSENWGLAQIGFIGMPILVAALSYIIVRYKSFHTEVIGAQVLVTALLVLVVSILFVTDISTIRAIITFTLVFVGIIGYQLIRGVKIEVEQREHLEELKKSLEASNEMLKVANAKLKDLDRLKTEFLSLASHQLRSPLTAVKGYTSMLLEGDFGAVNEQQKQAIDRVYQSVVHLTHVVEDLLNVTKIELGGMQYSMSPFDLSSTVEELVNELMVNAERKGLALTFNHDAHKTYTVYGDEEKLRQVFLNFIDNAVKYTETGSVSVLVSKDTAANKIMFSVTDTGMGMTEETIGTLFQKFVRTNESKSVNKGGSGLGLYLAKQIIDAHHGNLEVNSPGVGKGSTFKITFTSASPSTSSTEWKSGDGSTASSV